MKLLFDCRKVLKSSIENGALLGDSNKVTFPWSSSTKSLNPFPNTPLLIIKTLSFFSVRHAQQASSPIIPSPDNIIISFLVLNIFCKFSQMDLYCSKNWI